MGEAEFLNNPIREMLLICRRCDDKSDMTGSCRICLTYLHPREMTQIFPSTSTDSWKALISSVTNIEVNAGDGLPALLCCLCVSKLKHTKEFKEKSVAADNLLQNTLHQDGEEPDQTNHHLSAVIKAALPRVSKQHDGIADTSGLCRLCISVSMPDDMSPIFHDNGLDLLPEKIARTTSIKVSADDGLPSRICDCCLAKLRRAGDFVDEAEAKDLYLRTELFQVKREVCKLEVPNEALESNWKPRVKQEPGAWREEMLRGESVQEFHPEEFHSRNKEKDDKAFEIEFGTRNAIENHLPCTIKPKRAKRSRYVAKNEKPVKKDTNRFACLYCNKTYATKEYTLQHYKKFHKFKTQPFRCSQCRLVFLSQAALDEHELYDHRKRSFECDLCAKKFPTRLRCARHLSTHPEVKIDIEKTVQCDFCEKRFWGNYWLSRHMPVHLNERPFQCLICDKGFKKLCLYKVHQTIHATERPHKCEICEKSFKGKHNLRLHMLTHSNDGAFACKECNLRFHSPSNFRKHQMVHSDVRPYACDRCDKAFKTCNNLKKHSRTHVSAPFTCTECGKVLASAKSFRQHLQIHNADSHRQFRCHICDDLCEGASSLTEHLSVHQEQYKPFKCELCPARYYDKGTLDRHIRRVHIKERSYSCSICNKAYFRRKELTVHMSTHTGERPYECDLCKKTFVMRTNLRFHMAIHMENRLYYHCQQCKKTVTSMSSLRKHIQIMHPHVKPYKCKTCDEKFINERLLVRHSCSLVGMRPFACTVCKNSFLRHDHLAKHMAVHSDARPHGCTGCEKAFKSNCALQRHMKNQQH